MATKIPIKGIIEIDSSAGNKSLNELRKTANSLERDLKKLAVGSDEYNKKLSEFEAANRIWKENEKQLKETKKAAQDFNSEINNGSDIISSFKDRFVGNLQAIASGEITFKSLGGVIKFFAAESWAAISSIPLVGWLAAIAGGLALVVREAVNYNTEIQPLLKLLDNLGLDKKLIPQLRALKSAFGVESEAIADMLDNLVDSGIVEDQAAALESLKIALAKAPNKDELISYLTNSAETAKKLGLTFEQLINIKQDLESTPMNPEKVFGAMDTFVNRFLSQSEKIVPTLQKSFGGTFAANLFKGVTDGSIKYGDALTIIYKKGEELKISDKERADVAKALFGKSGASAYAYNEILKTISDSHRRINEDLSESQKETLRLADSYEELEKKKNRAFSSDAIRSLTYDVKILWNELKAGSLDALSSIVSGFKLMGMNTAAVFSNIPKYARIAFVGISADLMNLWNLFGAGKDLLKDVFTMKWDKIDGDLAAIKSKFTNAFKGISSASQQIGKDFGTGGNINQSSLRRINEGNASNAAALTEVEKRAAINALIKRGFTPKEAEAIFSGRKTEQQVLQERQRQTPDKPIRDDNSSAIKAAADKAAAERKKAQEQLEKDEADSNKRLLDLQQQYQDGKSALIEDEFLKEAQKEADRRNKEEQKNLLEIAELEKKKIDTKSLVAKTNLQKSIDILHAIEIQNEEAHQRNLRTIQEKEDAKTFEQAAQRAQRNIDKMRQADEDEINSITDLAEAKRQLTDQTYLQLTDAELRAIDNLEDAKAALRESADRKALAAQRDAINAQIAMLTQALNDPALSEEARAKMLADLDEVSKRATQLTSAINGGTDSDNKKVAEEQRAAKEKVDVFGFSVQDWEDTFKNLDTTADKLKAAGMIFQALSNIGAAFSETTRKLAEKDFQKFEQTQDKKKKSLLKQLNEGYITNEEYNKQVQRLEAETANKKAEMEYKQARADKIARMFSVIGNTAVGVASALPNLVLAGIVAAMGAIQLGIVAAQPLPDRPKFARGGFTGSGFGSPDETGFRPAGTVHENEYVVPEWITMSPRFANVIGYLESVRTGGTKPMAEGGLADSGSGSSAERDISSLIPTGTDPEMKAFLQKNIDFLAYLIANGVHIEKNAQNGKQIDEMVKEWTDLKNKNKH